MQMNAGIITGIVNGDVKPTPNPKTPNKKVDPVILTLVVIVDSVLFSSFSSDKNPKRTPHNPEINIADLYICINLLGASTISIVFRSFYLKFNIMCPINGLKFNFFNYFYNNREDKTSMIRNYN